MTTEVALRRETGAVAQFETRPAPLPKVLTHETRVDGYTHPLWLPVIAQGEERIAVEHSLIELEERLKPAERKTVIAMLAALAEFYDLRQDAAALKTRFAMLADDLAEFSADHIAAAIREHRQACNFYPKAELRSICMRRKGTAEFYRRRARIALKLEPVTDWEQALLDKVEAKRAADQADAEGPSPEMRVKLEERIAKLPPGLADSVRRMMAPQDEAKRVGHARKVG